MLIVQRKINVLQQAASLLKKADNHAFVNKPTRLNDIHTLSEKNIRGSSKPP